MAEQINASQEPLSSEQLFDKAHKYWQKAIADGRLYKTVFFSQVFESPDARVLREYFDVEMLMTINKKLNETWVELPPSYGRIDSSNR